MNFNINRFIEAQEKERTFHSVLEELRKGEIKEEFIPLTFPTMGGLNQGKWDNEFSFNSLFEAEVFVANNTLWNRYYESCEVLYNHNWGESIDYIMGSEENGKQFHASISLFYLFKEVSIFEEILNCYFNGELYPEILQLYEKPIKEFDKDYWREYKTLFYERAYFDDDCSESDDLDQEERYATFLDMALRGHSVTSLVRKYLYNHSDFFDHYRTSNTEMALFRSAKCLWRETGLWLDKQKDRSPYTEYVSLFPKGYFDFTSKTTWETAAYRFDSLIKFILENQKLLTFAKNLIEEYSTLRV